MLHAKRHDHAVTAFHRVLQLDPSMPEAHVNLGFALLGLGQARQARDFFESAIELRREQMNAYFGLAMALEALADLPGAVGAMRTYTHLVRDDDPYLAKARAALWEWEQRSTRAPLRRWHFQQWDEQPGAFPSTGISGEIDGHGGGAQHPRSDPAGFGTAIASHAGSARRSQHESAPQPPSIA